MSINVFCFACSSEWRLRKVLFIETYLDYYVSVAAFIREKYLIETIILALFGDFELSMADDGYSSRTVFGRRNNLVMYLRYHKMSLC